MVKKIEMVPSFSGVAKHVSRVQKVIAKIKQKKFVFEDVQDPRIAEYLNSSYSNETSQPIHPKMRMADVDEIKELYEAYKGAI